MNELLHKTEKIAVMLFSNAAELQDGLAEMLTRKEMQLTSIDGLDRIELFEETLSDGSKSFTIRLAASTPAQIRRERE